MIKSIKNFDGWKSEKKFSFYYGRNSDNKKFNSISKNSNYNNLYNKFGDISFNIIKNKTYNNLNSKKINIKNQFPNPEDLPKSKDEILKLINNLDKRIEELQNEDHINQGNLKSKINKTEIKINELISNKNNNLKLIDELKETINIHKNEMNILKLKYKQSKNYLLTENELELKKNKLEKKLKNLKLNKQNIIFENKLELEKKFRIKFEKKLFQAIINWSKDSKKEEILKKYRKLIKIKNKIIN